jgi:hypothetical protein
MNEDEKFRREIDEKKEKKKKQEVALGIYMFEGYKETCLSSSFDSRSIFTMILA